MAKKIFELAKEFDIGALDLVEKLKGQGLSVRNHMSVLSDEDLAKALEILNPTPDSSFKASTKKGTKDKVAPKVKKVKKEASSKDAPTAKPGRPKSKDKAAVVAPKKTTVIRRKSQDLALSSNEDDPLQASEEGGLSSSLTLGLEGSDSSYAEAIDSREDTAALSSSEGTSFQEETEKMRTGLRVVARPRTSATTTIKKADEILEERKVHKFTPVYIPPQEEGSVKKKEEDLEGGGNLSDEESSKKRLSGLASMMSGKVKVANRSQHITQSRADEELKAYSLALSSLGKPIYTQMRKKKQYLGPMDKTRILAMKDSKKVISIDREVLISTLSQKLSVKFSILADKALELNLLIKESDLIGLKLANILSSLFGFRVKDAAFNEEALLAQADEKKNQGKSKTESSSDKASKGKKDTLQTRELPLRPPVVTIMGHVDHGKTSLLDYIRKTKVAQAEAGGITQHLSSYQVVVEGKEITFLDTPGHAAFMSMRERGANLTDIVVLVVAADDGVMPQTKESIEFCKNADVSVIVAINKTDKEHINIDKVKTELSDNGLLVEDWGGDVQCVAVSALTGKGVDDLLEAILLRAEIMDLRADFKIPASGIVIESNLEAGRGAMAQVLIQKGTLNKGDALVVGESSGRARSIMTSTGEIIDSAGPSSPVVILGLDQVPSPGDFLSVAKNERDARKIVENRINERKNLTQSIEAPQKSVTLEEFFSTAQTQEKDKKILNLIVRTDVNGTYEAVKKSVEVLGNDEVGVKVIGGGVGAVVDSDVILASSASAIIVGFNMRPVTSARKLAEERVIQVKTYSIIYELINDIVLALEGLLAPESREEYLGRTEVKETFVIPKVGTIAGSLVVDGKIQRGAMIRLLRDSKIVVDNAKIFSLKRFKDDVKEVASGHECGVGLENYNDIKIGDIFEAYTIVETKRKLANP